MPRSARQFVETLSDEYLDCRRYGHDWRSLSVDARRGRFEVTLGCKRCTSEGFEVLNSRGEIVVRRRVKYVTGYLAKGVGSLDRNVVRLEAVLRQVDPTHHHEPED